MSPTMLAELRQVRSGIEVVAHQAQGWREQGDDALTVVAKVNHALGMTPIEVPPDLLAAIAVVMLSEQEEGGRR